MYNWIWWPVGYEGTQLTLLWHWKIPALIITNTVSEWRDQFRIHNNMLWDKRINYLILVHNNNHQIFLYTSYMFFFNHFVWVSKMLCAKFLCGKFSLFYYNSVISVKVFHYLQVTIWDCVFHLLHLVWDARTIVNQLFSANFLPILNS